MSRLNKTNVEVAKQMPMLNKRSIEFEKRRSYVKTSNKLNFDRKNAPSLGALLFFIDLVITSHISLELANTVWPKQETFVISQCFGCQPL